jgi:uncharacterized protein (TIGR02246 family)
MECDLAAVVQQYLDALNRKNAVAAVEMFAPEAGVFVSGDPKPSIGRAAIRKDLEDTFRNAPDLKISVGHRTVLSHHVVDEFRWDFEGRGFTGVAVYRVDNCLIQRADLYQ